MEVTDDDRLTAREGSGISQLTELAARGPQKPSQRVSGHRNREGDAVMLALPERR